MSDTFRESRPIRVVIIMPLAEQRGGAELMLLHLAEHGGAAGIESTIIFLEDGPMLGYLRQKGIRVELVEAGRVRDALKLARAVRSIAAIVRHQSADLILGWISKAHLYGAPAAFLTGVPAVWYQLGVPSKRVGTDFVATLLPARGILVCSAASGTAQARLYPRRRMSVVYPGVELRKFDPGALPVPAEARRRLGIPPDVPVVGIVGRLQRWKGIHTLIDAMPRIRARVPKAICLVVGGEHTDEPDYPGFLRERIAALGLKDHTVLTGLQRNVPEWVQAMDVVVHASENEPFGLVVIEAMAMGKPLAASNVGGPLEVIRDGVDGVLWQMGDAEALAEAVIRYFEFPDFARQVGEAGKTRAAEFSVERYVERMATTLREFLGMPEHGAPLISK